MPNTKVKLFFVDAASLHGHVRVARTRSSVSRANRNLVPRLSFAERRHRQPQIFDELLAHKHASQRGALDYTSLRTYQVV